VGCRPINRDNVELTSMAQRIMDKTGAACVRESCRLYSAQRPQPTQQSGGRCRQRGQEGRCGRWPAASGVGAGATRHAVDPNAEPTKGSSKRAPRLSCDQSYKGFGDGGTRSVPDAIKLYQECILQRVEMAKADAQRFSDECGTIMQKVNRSLTNGWSVGST